MTQLYFTINQQKIQNLINESVDNKFAKYILTKVLMNLLKKKEVNIQTTKPTKEILAGLAIVMDTISVTTQQKQVP